MKPAGGDARGLGRPWGAALAALLLALSLAQGPAGATEPPKPRRIASLNVCTDQLLLLLGLRARLVSVTFLAADPSSSAMPEAARGLHLNRGRAEEILPLRPDLVLAGATAATPTVQLLRRLGHRVVVVPLATRLDDIPRNIETVARATGEQARGRKLIAEFRKELKRITAELPDTRKGAAPSAMLFGPGCVTSGAQSLAGAIIPAAGCTNGMASFGLAGLGPRSPARVPASPRRPPPRHLPSHLAFPVSLTALVYRTRHFPPASAAGRRARFMSSLWQTSWIAFSNLGRSASIAARSTAPM